MRLEDQALDARIYEGMDTGAQLFMLPAAARAVHDRRPAARSWTELQLQQWQTKE